jgi:hypothetical protein
MMMNMVRQKMNMTMKMKKKRRKKRKRSSKRLFLWMEISSHTCQYARP